METIEPPLSTEDDAAPEIALATTLAVDVS